MFDFSNMIIDIFSIISNKVEYEIILIQINDKPFFVLTKEETSLCFVIICFYLSGAIFILSTLPFHPLRSPYSLAKCDDLSISTVCDGHRLVFIRIYFSVVQLKSLCSALVSLAKWSSAIVGLQQCFFIKHLIRFSDQKS